jgi:hypothetical protein
VSYVRATAEMAREAARLLGTGEGLLPDPTTAAALGWACAEAARMKQEQAVVMLAETAGREPGALRRLGNP